MMYLQHTLVICNKWADDKPLARPLVCYRLTCSIRTHCSQTVEHLTLIKRTVVSIHPRSAADRPRAPHVRVGDGSGCMYICQISILSTQNSAYASEISEMKRRGHYILDKGNQRGTIRRQTDSLGAEGRTCILSYLTYLLYLIP